MHRYINNYADIILLLLELHALYFNFQDLQGTFNQLRKFYDMPNWLQLSNFRKKVIPIFKQVVLEPRVSPEHTWKYVDTVIFFAKTWTKGHLPLDDLWPHICWGLMCDSTQGSLCPSPMKIHQSMWIQWPILQKLEAKVIDP